MWTRLSKLSVLIAIFALTVTLEHLFRVWSVPAAVGPHISSTLYGGSANNNRSHVAGNTGMNSAYCAACSGEENCRVGCSGLSEVNFVMCTNGKNANCSYPTWTLCSGEN